MKYSRISAVLLLLLVASCKHSRQDMLMKRWQQTSVENNEINKAIKQQQDFIDTLGTHTTAQDNIEIYGSNNIDSLKQTLKAELIQFRQKQQDVKAQTWFEFKPDSNMYMHSDEGLDSAKWFLDEEGNVIMKDEENNMVMQVVAISDTALTLKFTQVNATSVMHFIPAKNK